MQSLCTLRNHCRQWPRNTRYQAGAAPYLGRSSTGWIAPACLAHVAVGTCVSSHAPRTEPYVRLSRIRLPPRLCDGNRGRIRSSAFVTRAWLWVQYVLCWCVFPLAPALRSTDSAALAPADASAVGFLRFVRRLHCCRVGRGGAYAPPLPARSNGSSSFS